MASGDSKRSGFILGALLVAGVALITAACGGSSDGSSTETPPAADTPVRDAQEPTEPMATEPMATEPTEADPMDGPGSELPSRIEIETRDNFFLDIQPGIGEPGRIEAPANSEFTVRLTNEGVLPHNITFLTEEGGAVLAEGASGRIILEGESASVTFQTPDAGTYFFYCTVHPFEMIGEFIVR